MQYKRLWKQKSDIHEKKRAGYEELRKKIMTDVPSCPMTKWRWIRRQVIEVFELYLSYLKCILNGIWIWNLNGIWKTIQTKVLYWPVSTIVGSKWTPALEKCNNSKIIWEQNLTFFDFFWLYACHLRNDTIMTLFGDSCDVIRDNKPVMMSGKNRKYSNSIESM